MEVVPALGRGTYQPVRPSFRVARNKGVAATYSGKGRHKSSIKLGRRTFGKTVAFIVRQPVRMEMGEGENNVFTSPAVWFFPGTFLCSPTASRYSPMGT